MAIYRNAGSLNATFSAIVTFKIAYYFVSVGLTPDKPQGLTVTNITSRSAAISWLEARRDYHILRYFFRRHRYRFKGRYDDFRISGFLIQLKKNRTLVQNITTGKVNEYKLYKLAPHSWYEVSIAAGNHYGFGEFILASFLTFEEG